MRADESWMAQAARTCARSAAAYEAALLLAIDDSLDKSLIERCQARHALLEGLLVALGRDGADASALRATLPRASSSRSTYQCLSDALGAARRLDGRLKTLVRRTGDMVSAGADRACAP